MSWLALQGGDPELADFGADRFASGVAYLATVKPDGGPRVHPVTPILAEGRLFLFMEPTSPKGDDLRRQPRYALHCSVLNADGEGGEFLVNGSAELNSEEADWALAAANASYDPVDRYLLFELSVEAAFSTVYGEDGTAARRRWSRS